MASEDVLLAISGPRHDRRAILALGAGSALALGTATILGLKFVKARRPDSGSGFPAWINAGLNEARASGLPPVVIVVPADDKEMIAVSNALIERLKSPELIELFAGAVWMCLREGDAEGVLPAGIGIHRLDVNGAVEDSCEVPLHGFTTDAAFLKVAGPLVERDFAERVHRAWERVKDPENVRTELKTLDWCLNERMPAIAPILIAERRSLQDPKARATMGELLGGTPVSPFPPFSRSRRSDRLPYGAEWGDDFRTESDPCLWCGMGNVSAPRVIKFLAVRQRP